MKPRNSRRDDDNKSGGRKRIPYSKPTEPKSNNSSYNTRKDGSKPPSKLTSFNEGPAKRTYTRRDEGSGSKPFTRKFDNDGPAKRSYTRRDEGSTSKPFARKFDNDGPPKRSYTRRDEGSGSKPFTRKFENDGPPKRSYTRRDEGSGSKPFTRKFENDGPQKRSYTRRDEGSTSKPFARKFDNDGPPKRSYTRRDEGSTGKPFARKFDNDGPPKRTYTRRDSNPDERSFTPKPRFDKDNQGFEKPRFIKRSDDRDKPFERKTDGPRDADGFQKRSFNSRESGGEKRPYTKREPGSYDKPFQRKSYGDSKRPYKSSNEGYARKPYGKSKTSESETDGDFVRLNRFLSNSGICSRREADDLISSGVIAVNGVTVTELGTKVNPFVDEVRYNNEPVRREKLQYIVMNKPKDFITTTDDPQERKTVSSLVERLTSARVYPVGRLDRNTTGVLLLTNDGDLTMKLTHPKFGITKVYAVELDKKLRQDDFNQIREGLNLEDGEIKVDDVAYIEGMDKNHIGVQLHSGRNRIVRRIFESLGYRVVKLDRTSFASLSKKGLKRGECRFLTPAEVGRLKNLKS
jgi:23S rRNA pseudouridine2605 synthase